MWSLRPRSKTAISTLSGAQYVIIVIHIHSMSGPKFEHFPSLPGSLHPRNLFYAPSWPAGWLKPTFYQKNVTHNFKQSSKGVFRTLRIILRETAKHSKHGCVRTYIWLMQRVVPGLVMTNAACAYVFLGGRGPEWMRHEINPVNTHDRVIKALLSLDSYYWNSTLFHSSSCFPALLWYSRYSGKPQPFSVSKTCLHENFHKYLQDGNLHRKNKCGKHIPLCFSTASHLPINEGLSRNHTRLGHSIGGRQRTPW